MRNIKLAVRMLLKAPFVTTVAVLSLALGIGANAAIYSMFDQLLVKSLPVPEANRLVNITAPGPTPGSTSCNQQGDCDEIFSYPMFRDLERQQTALQYIVGTRLFGASLAIDNEPSTAEGIWVSGQYFAALGVQPALGRLLTPADDSIWNGHDVVVISHDLWTNRFGGRPNVVGSTMVVNGRTMEIIGVTPPEFTGATVGSKPAVYVSMSMRGAFATSRYTGHENRREYWMYVFGRLKPDGTVEQATAGLNAIYRPIITDVEAPLQEGMSDQTMERFKAKQIVLSNGRRGQSDIHREASTPLLMLFAVTGTVLLIACANIANLLLARGAGRATEMGVRLALGATRKHLLVQLLTESMILALAGGAVSLLIAKWTLDGIYALLPPEARSTLLFTIDPSVIAFAGITAILTGLIFGLFPALHSTRADLISTIRAGAGQIAGGRAAARFRSGLVTVQIALSMALLASAGLFLKSLVNVSRVDLGIVIDDVLTFNVTPSRVGYDTLRAGVLLRRIEQEMAAIPGVKGVTSSMVPLIAGSNWGTDVRVQGFECGPDTDCNSRYSEVGPNFFTTMEMPLVAGRDILESDMVGAAPVVVVNEAFVEKFNLGADAVGKFMGWRAIR
jgi:predicted permease